jgi:putative SOS response-associated peptidase YedK
MCYDVSFTVDIQEMADYFPDLIFDVHIEMNFDATIHIIGHDYGNHPIVYTNRQDQILHCRLMEWGCIPYYITDEKQFIRQRASMLNARSERILTDENSYWNKIRNRRCVIPVSGIYEHREVKGWKKKVPYFIRLKDQPIFFIPGLYSVADLPDPATGELLKRWTYTLITRDANEVMKMIHNGGDNKYRMPLFLPLEMSKEWLTEDLSIERYKEILDFEMPSDQLEFHPVYTIRSPKTRPDSKLKYEYWEWEKLPALGEMNPE